MIQNFKNLYKVANFLNSRGFRKEAMDILKIADSSTTHSEDTVDSSEHADEEPLEHEDGLYSELSKEEDGEFAVGFRGKPGEVSFGLSHLMNDHDYFDPDYEPHFDPEWHMGAEIPVGKKTDLSAGITGRFNSEHHPSFNLGGSRRLGPATLSGEVSIGEHGEHLDYGVSGNLTIPLGGKRKR